MPFFTPPPPAAIDIATAILLLTPVGVVVTILTFITNQLSLQRAAKSIMVTDLQAEIVKKDARIEALEELNRWKDNRIAEQNAEIQRLNHIITTRLEGR